MYKRRHENKNRTVLRWRAAEGRFRGFLRVSDWHVGPLGRRRGHGRKSPGAGRGRSETGLWTRGRLTGPLTGQSAVIGTTRGTQGAADRLRRPEVIGGIQGRPGASWGVLGCRTVSHLSGRRRIVGGAACPCSACLARVSARGVARSARPRLSAAARTADSVSNASPGGPERGVHGRPLRIRLRPARAPPGAAGRGCGGARRP